MIKFVYFLFFFSFFTLISFAFPSKTDASWQDFLKEQITERVDLNGEKIRLLIFKNSDFSQVTNRYQINQLMHIKVEVAGSGEKQRVVRILDNRKKEVNTRVLEQSGKGPFVYTATIKAPEKDGVYYLDIKIESEDFSFASQESIIVGNVAISKNISTKVDLKLPDSKSIATSSGNSIQDNKPQAALTIPFSQITEYFGSFITNLIGFTN